MMRTAALSLFASLLALSFASGKADKYRLVWNDDPSTTMTVAWNQTSGDDAAVYYTTDPEQDDWTRHAPDRRIDYRGMDNRFARLKGLEADTAYHFQIRDSEGSSDTYWFKTAPDEPSKFTFVAGGDSRTNAEPRRWGNRLIAKIRPLFILHGADYMGNGSTEEWHQWLDEWQLTVSEDGRMYPVIASHGNHENADKRMVYNIFDTPHPDSYYALSLAGGMIRLYTLNTELEPGVGYGDFSGQDDSAWNAQNEWFENDLREHIGTPWKIVNYHRPMRPHTRGKSEGLGRIKAWAPLFYQYGVQLAVECDTHMVKYTYPLRPSTRPGSFQTFERDYQRGTTFIGEGSWGAPKRPVNDDKPWTLASDSFWQFKLIHAEPENLHIRTVRFESEEDVTGTQNLTQEAQNEDPFAIPEGIFLWKPPAGEVLRLPFGGAEILHLNLFSSGQKWKYWFGGEAPPPNWYAAEFDDDNWKSGISVFGTDAYYVRTKLGDGSGPTPDSAFFRTEFKYPEKAQLNDIRLWILRDDGAVVYLNGEEIDRSNMPRGPISPETPARRETDGKDEREYFEVKIDSSRFKPGLNTIAVSVHQHDEGDDDLLFDAAMSGYITFQPKE